MAISRTSDGLPVVLSALTIVAALPSHAGDWRLTPRFSVDQEVTDNVQQQDVDPTGDYVTQLRPGFSLRGSGARVSSNIDYNFVQSLFARNGNLDSSNHQLQGSTDIEVIRNHVTVRSDSTVSQQLVDAQGLVSNSNRSRNGNRADVVRYSVSPNARYSFGDWAAMNYTFSFDSAKFSDRSRQNAGFVGGFGGFGAGNDSDQFSHDFALSSGSKFMRTPMTFRYSRRKNEFGGGDVDRLESISGDIGYDFTRTFRGTLTLGDDTNDFRSAQNNRQGFYWLVGGTWRPTERTTINGNFGDRFFGNTFNVSVSHTQRRWSFSLDYNEEVSSNNRVQDQLTFVPLTDGFGNAIFDPITSSVFGVLLDTPTLRNEIFVAQNLATTLNYRGRRNTLRIRFTENTRDFEFSGINEVIRVLSTTFERRLSPKTTFITTGTWREASQDQAGAGDLVSIDASLRYHLGPHTNLHISYRFADQAASEQGRNGYTEHAMTAGLVFNF